MGNQANGQESWPIDKVDRFKLISGYVLGGLAYAACFFIAARIPAWWLNIPICLFGGILGWCIGMLVSPLNPEERREFTDYGKAVSAFVGGFVIAKFDFAYAGATTKVLLADPTNVGRLLLFGTSLCLGFQFTFVGRRYFRRTEQPRGSGETTAMYPLC